MSGTYNQHFKKITKKGRMVENSRLLITASGMVVFNRFNTSNPWDIDAYVTGLFSLEVPHSFAVHNP